MRRCTALLTALGLTVLLAQPASADDIYEIDERLQDAGFTEAYTGWYEVVDADGSRFVVDFDSGSSSAAAWQQEARDAAGLVWEHVEGRVISIDVSSVSTAPWTPGELPPTVTLSRTQLEQEFGARPAELDTGYPAEEDEGEGEAYAGFDAAQFGYGVLGALVVLVVAAAVAGVVLLGRRRAAVPPGGWGAPAWPGAGWPEAAPAGGAWPTGAWPADGAGSSHAAPARHAPHAEAPAGTTSPRPPTPSAEVRADAPWPVPAR